MPHNALLNLVPRVFNHRLVFLTGSPESLHVQAKKAKRILPLRTRTGLCLATSSYSTESQEISRRSANYHPTIWDHHLIESIRSPYADGEFNTRIEELKVEVKILLLEAYSNEPLAKLELINSLQRLGVAYHFNEEISIALQRVYADNFESLPTLYETSLCFRLLRQHGHSVSSDVFGKFRDGEGFKNCLCQDVKGLLSLYEASHLGMHGEKLLEEAKEFSVRHLKCLGEKVDLNLVEQVKHSLEVPLHWGMPRLEARHYIDMYEREERRSSLLLELAKLDFNVIQSIHQREVKELSRWWKELGLGEKLNFSRDRLFENYVWAAGFTFEPKFSKCRMVLTKLVCILTVIDDIYDVYGSLEELKLFTAAIKSWDSSAMQTLPDYMKLCFLALKNFVNETAYDILRDCGRDDIGFMKKGWEQLCEAYLEEAEWFNEGHIPTLREYLENAWISVGGPIAMVHAYFLIEHTIKEKPSNFFEQSSAMIYWSSLILRLSDDLMTSKAEMERGDTPKSVQCRMNDSNESDEISREYIKGLVNSSWMNLNEEFLRTDLPLDFINMVLNMARTAQCIYQHGDGIGNSTGIMKERITALFIEHVAME